MRGIGSDGVLLSTPEVKTDMVKMARDARETVKLVQERVLVGLSSHRARGEANCQSGNCFH